MWCVTTRIEDAAVVLRAYPLGEADRILSLITAEHGLVRAVAKGVRKPSSRFGSRLQPLNQVQVMLYRGRNLGTVSSVDSVRLFGSQMAGDYVRWSAGHVLAEATERLVSEEMEPARPHYRLLVSGLAALADDKRDARLVIDAFLLQSLATGGWAPSFSDCAQCGSAGPHRWIHLASGGAVCERCRPTGAVSISAGTAALLGDLLSGDWGSAALANTTARRAASGVVAAYLQLHLERDLRSLPIADRAWLSELSLRLDSDEDVVA
jgi:DNA repair protein RecO (recombination protein O)